MIVCPVCQNEVANNDVIAIAPGVNVKICVSCDDWILSLRRQTCYHCVHLYPFTSDKMCAKSNNIRPDCKHFLTVNSDGSYSPVLCS